MDRDTLGDIAESASLAPLAGEGAAGLFRLSLLISR